MMIPQLLMAHFDNLSSRFLMEGVICAPLSRKADSAQCKPKGRVSSFPLSPHIFCVLLCHLPLLTNTSELCLHMEGRKIPSTEPTAGGELDEEAASFKTRAFPQKKELFEALIQEGMKEEEEELEGWYAACDSVKAQGGEIIYTIDVSGG